MRITDQLTYESVLMEVGVRLTGVRLERKSRTPAEAVDTHIPRVSTSVWQPKGAARQSPSDQPALADGQARRKSGRIAAPGGLVWERIQAWVLQFCQPRRGQLAASPGPRLTKKWVSTIAAHDCGASKRWVSTFARFFLNCLYSKLPLRAMVSIIFKASGVSAVPRSDMASFYLNGTDTAPALPSARRLLYCRHGRVQPVRHKEPAP